MRASFDVSNDDIKKLKYLKHITALENNSEIITEAIDFFWHIHYLLENDYKVALEDPKGARKYFSLKKRKKKKGKNDAEEND